jgi:hypothetical protein
MLFILTVLAPNSFSDLLLSCAESACLALVRDAIAFGNGVTCALRLGGGPKRRPSE